MATRRGSGIAVGAVALNPGSVSSSHVGPKRFSKRRERSTAQLNGAMCRVNEQLSVAPQIVPQSLAGGHTNSDTPGSPASMRRKNVSLWLPRVRTPDMEEDICGTEAPSTCGSRETANITGSPGCAGALGDDLVAGGISVDSNHLGSTTEELEDLRLQNAVLRRSLAMLQQSVVDSMKGGKPQFMGNGIFRPRKTLGAIDGGSGPGRPEVNQQDAANLEGLQAALTERRNALKTALAERDEAVRDAQSARREAKELSVQNQELSDRLQDCQAQLQRADAAQKAAEADSVSAAQRTTELEARVEALRAEAATTLQRSLAAVEEEAAALRAQLEAARDRYTVTEAERASLAAEHPKMIAQIEALQADIQRFQENSTLDNERLARLLHERHAFAQRILANAFSDSCPLHIYFHGWASCLNSAREVRLAELVERVRKLEADAARLTDEVDAARAEGDVARADAVARAREADESQQLASEAEEKLKVAKDLATQWERHSKDMECRTKSLTDEISRLKARTDTANGTSAQELRAAKERIQQLQKELDSASAAATEVATQRDACASDAAEAAARLSSEAATREAVLQKELQAAVQAVASAREAEATAGRQRDEAKKRADELENQTKNTLQELQNVQRRAEEAEKRAREFQGKVDYLQKRINTLEAKAVNEQARTEEANELVGQNAVLENELLKLKAMLESARGSSQQSAAQAGEISELKLALAEARCDAKSATEKLRVLRDEHAAVKRALEGEQSNRSEVEKKKGELDQNATRFAAEARRALQEAKQNIRIMVTAPKVCINVGGNENNVHVPFPFAAIKESVQSEVVPKFSRVCAIGEEVGDAEVRQDVQSMVEQLALTLQSKVHELMPQAEGTCNWDGFGAKCGKLDTMK